MRNFRAAIVLGVYAILGHAQTTDSDKVLLSKARAAYDAPFNRNLQSFECGIDFNWKQHWTETLRVGDEGTDEEIQKFIQPIRNRVAVTHDDAIVSSGMTEEQEHKPPAGEMAEGLLKHAVRFSLRTWLAASTNSLLPSLDTPVRFQTAGSGYLLHYKVQTFDITMMLTPGMALQGMGVEGSASDRQDLEFHPGPQGLVMGSWTMGEDGDFKPGNRLIFTYTYQTIGGFQIPSQMVVNRESHHEVWRYTLSGCKVTTR